VNIRLRDAIQVEFGVIAVAIDVARSDQFLDDSPNLHLGRFGVWRV
jgi:hypothetical protein